MTTPCSSKMSSARCSGALHSEPNFTWFSVECENFESIHNHQAYAYTDFTRKPSATRKRRPPRAVSEAKKARNGGWKNGRRGNTGRAEIHERPAGRPTRVQWRETNPPPCRGQNEVEGRLPADRSIP